VSAATALDLDAVRLRLEIEDFYAREADLLDERRFDEWLDLLHPDIRYRIPMSQNVHSKDAAAEFLTDDLAVCWMDEGKRTLTQRVEQLKTGLHWAEEPMSRTCHIYSNTRVLDSREETGTRRVKAKTRFLVYRNRLQSEVDLLVGKRVDELIAHADSGWKVVARTVYLDQTVLLSNNLTTFL
jgi:3-phenylpropionate/cinnamic acid dioxygenase small subunit